MHADVTTSSLSQARFRDVKVGGWFRETPDGAWHLKSRGGRAIYMSASVVGRPEFGPDEVVLVPDDRSSAP